MGDHTIDIPKDTRIDESDDYRPRQLISERSNDVDLSESHRHEGYSDIGLSAADLQQRSAVFERLGLA